MCNHWREFYTDKKTLATLINEELNQTNVKLINKC